MSKGRLEAFSDGVLAIIITIMVLEMKAPADSELAALAAVVPAFISYILSFAYIGIYWNNHHHLLQASEHVTGGVLWANLHLLFWLSLIPFTTQWMGENHFAPWPVAIYGMVLLFAGIAYFMLVRALVAQHSEESVLTAAIGKDWKGIASVVLYVLALPMAFVSPITACGLYLVVAVIWLVPDRRIESRLLNDRK